jgi:O-antigen/teichoic acid export membrane protein
MQILGAVQSLIERSLLTNYSGFTELGKYAHSQSYQALLVQGTNAMSRAVWPLTLIEARENPQFPITRRAWTAVHLGLALVSAPLVLFGDRLIAALTNGKLTGAWVFLAPWCLVVILQATGKPATGVLYALGDGSEVARLGLLSNIVVIVGMCVLVPIFHAAGAAFAIVIQSIFFRVTIQLLARRRAHAPFQDTLALLACALVIVLFLVRRYGSLGTTWLALILVATEVGALVFGRRVIRDALGALPVKRGAQGGLSPESHTESA